MLTLKEKGKITNVLRTISYEKIGKILGKSSLCASCAVCGCFRNIDNEAITLAVKTHDGLFVGECDNYKPAPERRPVKSERTTTDGNSAVTILHPNVRHTFIR